MKKEESKLIFKQELQKEKDIITIISALPEVLLNKYRYNFDKIRNKIVRIKTENENDRIYKIHEAGFLNSDGYEKNYIYIFKGSKIILYSSENDEEYVSLIDKDGNSKLLYSISNGAIASIEAEDDMLINSHKMVLEVK